MKNHCWKSLVEMLGQDRLVLVDVGARDGIPDHWALIGPALNAVAFEADNDAAMLLDHLISATGAIATIRSEGVWSFPGRKTLNVTRSGGCSSFYSPRYEFLEKFPHADRFEIIDQRKLDVSTIDLVLEQLNLKPQFIKIDAQGGALPILKGAKEGLASVFGLELEVELTAMYKGEPLFGAVDAFVRSRGFELVDLRPTYWRRSTSSSVAGTRGQLIFCDALYMLAPHLLAERLGSLANDSNRLQLAKALLCCKVYGLNEWVVDYLHAVGWSMEYPVFMQLLRHAQRGVRVAGLFGSRSRIRSALGLIVKDIGDLLLESGTTWGKAEQRLGNKMRSSRYFRFLR